MKAEDCEAGERKAEAGFAPQPANHSDQCKCRRTLTGSVSTKHKLLPSGLLSELTWRQSTYAFQAGLFHPTLVTSTQFLGLPLVQTRGLCPCGKDWGCSQPSSPSDLILTQQSTDCNSCMQLQSSSCALLADHMDYECSLPAVYMAQGYALQTVVHYTHHIMYVYYIQITKFTYVH